VGLRKFPITGRSTPARQSSGGSESARAASNGEAIASGAEVRGYGIGATRLRSIGAESEIENREQIGESLG